MTITVEIDFCKENISDFSDLAKTAYQYALAFGRELVQRIVEERDAELRKMRDKSRYVNKGKRKTCLKTLLGNVEFERTVYVDRAVPEGHHCVFLLDEDLSIDTVGLVSPDACEAIANAICETTYRGASQMLSETSGLTLSPQGVWDVVQKLGAYRGEQLERLRGLAKAKRTVGCIETKLLYEEDDGVWLPLQGEDRKKYGPSKEMKVGIAYDGVLWSGGKTGKARRELHNKIAYTSFDSVSEYREHKEGLVASRFNVKNIAVRIRNGDGAGWVQGFGNADINVLDVFHRNKALLTHVQNADLRKLLMKHLYDKNIPMLLACIEALINSEEDTSVQEHYRTLRSYYENNADGLLSAYDRGVTIPETGEPGVIHHARLGSMESNVFTLVGNRMKGRRACWSIRGATNLANLLCLYHTTGFSGMFTGLSVPTPEVPAIDDWKSLSASQMPLKTGKGFECWKRTTVPNLPWLKALTGYQSLAEIRLS